MPLYEYQCTACGKLTEKRQKFSDPEITECPYCGGRLERTITAPAVQFKGGGWYADLYSSGKKPAAGKAAESGGSGESSAGSGESSGSSSESSGSSSKSESAPSAPAASTAPAAPAGSSTTK